MDIGGLSPAPARGDARSGESEWERREWREMEEERRKDAEELGAEEEEERPLYPPRRGVGGGFLLSFHWCALLLGRA